MEPEYGELDERGLPPGKTIRPGLEIGPYELRDMLGGGRSPVLIDVREPDEWRICTLGGAIEIPLGEVGERAEEVLDLLEDEGRGPDEPVIVYCHHGVRSLTGAALLQAAGVRGARSLAGGIDLWAVAVDPSVVRY